MTPVTPIKHEWPLRFSASTRQANDMLGVDGMAIVRRVRRATS
jgi:hypothetical protein